MSVLLFEELWCLDTETIVACMTIESVLQTCHNSLENYTATTAEVLQIWLERLLPAYILRAENCIEILRCLHEWFQFHLKCTLEQRSRSAIDKFTESLEQLRDFVLWVEENPITNERLGQTTSFFVMSVIYSWMEERYKYDVEDLEIQDVYILEILFTWLIVLRDITSRSRQAHARLPPLLNVMQEIANILDCNPTQQDALVETNKSITDICVHYVTIEEQTRNEEEQRREEVEQRGDEEDPRRDDEDNSRDAEEVMPQWLQDAVIHLGQTILCHTAKLHVQFSTERALMVQEHFTMLQKLFSSGVRKINIKAYDTIHNLFNGILFKSENDQDIENIIQRLRPKVMKLYEQIYKLETFQMHLETYLNHPEIGDMDHYEICMGFVVVTIIDDEPISQSTCRTLEEILQYLLKDALYFTTASDYDRFLETFASLLYSVDSSKLFKYFVDGLFQGDIIKSQACTDVLLLSFRLRESEHNWSQSDIDEAKSFWMKCNSSYAMFSNNLNQWHVQRILRYFHNLDKNKELPAFSMANYRYLHCVSAPTEQETQFWKMRIQRILKTPLSDKEQYYELVALLHLVALGEANWLGLISGSVQDILRNDVPNWATLANVFFKLALNASESSQEQILQYSLPEGELLSGCWYLQKFIYTCRKSDQKTLSELGGQCTIAKNFKILLDAATHVPAPGFHADQFDNLEWKHKHLYRKCQSSECSLKRKWLNTEHKDLISQLKETSKKLARYPRALDESDVLQLRGIIGILERVLP